MTKVREMGPWLTCTSVKSEAQQFLLCMISCSFDVNRADCGLDMHLLESRPLESTMVFIRAQNSQCKEISEMGIVLTCLRLQ